MGWKGWNVTLEQIKNGKIVIFSHYATTGACEELRDWLRHIKAGDVVYVAFPFGQNPDRFIRVERYRNGELIEKCRSLFGMRLPEPLAYAKDFLYALCYAARFGRRAEVLVAGDNLLALAAVTSRCLSRVRRVVYYMIDYTPVRYANRMLNGLYYFVDRLAASCADAVWPLTEQMIRARFDAGRLDERRVRWYSVPYGSHPVEEDAAARFCPTNVVYMGDVVRNKGAELFVPLALELKRLVPACTFTVIGGGRDLAGLRDDVEKAGLTASFELCGFVAAMDDVVNRLVKGGVAIAPYYPFDVNSFTFYSDPGKVKVYLGCGLPIVLTNVPPIALTIEREGAGLIATYDAAEMAAKVASLMRSPEYSRYRDNARRLGWECAWDKVFLKAFERLDEA